jgi:CubicO group peptidase (beta-lactamase class C family)
VRQAFAANFESDFEVGASVSVVVNGASEVDLWAGHTDMARTKPWQQDTIVNVWSSTKTQMYLVCLMLADRGELDLHAPVAKYWPEFAANGKENVQVRHFLSHSAGLPGWDEPLQQSDLWDHDKCAAVLARQRPWWEPGTASGYHAISQGYLVGEVVRRVTGESLGTFFRKEIAEPLGADFHIGTPEELDHRVALVIPPDAALPPDMDPSGIAMRVFANPPMDPAMALTPQWRRCESPAANGHGNARSLARTQSIISNGGEVDGRRFLSEATCRRVFEQQTSGVDMVLGLPVTFGMGYANSTPEMPIGGPGACFWGGWGGSLVVNDLDHRMTITYVMNRMGDGTVGDARGAGIVMAAYAALS